MKAKPSSSDNVATGDASEQQKKPSCPWETTSYPNILRYKPTGTYVARIKFHDKIRKRSLETDDFKVAKEKYPIVRDQLQNEILEDEQLQNSGPVPVTMGDCVSIYKQRVEDDVEIGAETKEYYMERLAALLRTWEGLSELPIGKVTRETCDAWAKTFKGKFHGTNYNNTRAILITLLDIAVEKGVIRKNPAEHLGRVKVALSPPDLPSREQFQELLKEIESWKKADAENRRDYADIVRFLSASGARVSEAAGVRWKDVDWKHSQLVINAGDPEMRRIPLLKNLEAVLHKLKKQRNCSGSFLPD